MKNLLFVTAFIFWGAGFAQEKKLLNEQFSDNSGNWPSIKTAVSSAAVNTARGVYILRYKDVVNNLAVMKDIGVDAKRDFKFEAKFYKEKGVKNYGYGIIWGGRPDNYYSVLIAGTGYYCYGKVVDGVWTDITDWVHSPVISQGNKSYNSVAVSKIGGTYYFDINNNRVATIQAEGVFGNQVGFNVNNKQTILVDWATFTYLN